MSVASVHCGVKTVEEILGDAAPEPVATRGWYRLYIGHVIQADTGADLDFRVGASGPAITRESH